MDCIDEALLSVDPSRLLKTSMKLDSGKLVLKNKKFDLGDYDKILVVGGGKASGAMAVAIEELLPDRITDGYVNILKGTKNRFHPSKIRLNEASHPVPDQEGVSGSREIVKLLQASDEKTFVICLISGGGSSLIPLPARGISLEDLVKTTELLLRSGAEIDRMNCVRKHISAIKGGQLVRYAKGATILSLIISDVVGDHLESIASGPTFPDQTTFFDAKKVLGDFRVEDKVPQSVRQRILDGCNGSIPDTPKPGDPIFSTVTNSIIGSNEIACRKIEEHLWARNQPFDITYLGSSVTGEASDVASALVTKVNHRAKERFPKAVAFVWGGETTVTVHGNGVGGRNQEQALSALLEIGKIKGKGLTFAFFGTDGIDGKTKAAGAIVDSGAVQAAEDRGLDPSDYLKRNDSYTFFKRVRNSLIITGATGTNVNDIGIAIAGLDT